MADLDFNKQTGLGYGLGALFQAEGPERSGRLVTIPGAGMFTGGASLPGPYSYSDRESVIPPKSRAQVLKELKDAGISKEAYDLYRGQDGVRDPFKEGLGFMPETPNTLEGLQAELKAIRESTAPVSIQESRKKIVDRIEGMPDDSDVFAASPLDMMAAPMPEFSVTAEGKKVTGQTSGAADEATAQSMIVAKQTKADANREASLDRQADPTEQLFSSAMSEFIKDARTETEDDLPEVGDIESYKKKFAEATGVDISGKPDTSQALMAMGLSMMQNRAGKRFNVGKILNAVGVAGEKAMPALAAAKADARNNVIAAGKYALQSESADEKTRKAAEKELMNRGKYWVFSKGGKEGEFSNFEKGEFVDLNKAEMNKLITDPKFDEQYSFVDASTRFDILAKRAEGQELGDMWGKKPEPVSLIGGAAKEVPKELQVFGTYANPNYNGTPDSKILLAEKPKEVIRRFLSYQDGIDKGAVKFKDLLENIDEGISIGEQFLGSAQQFLINIGFEGDTSTEALAKQALKNFAIDEATNILKESGKTLSDGDRKLVKERVGEIDWANADPKLLKKQIEFVYDVVILQAQKNLDTAIGKLESDFGISVRPTTKSGPKDQAEVDEFNKMYGTDFTLETFPKD